MRVELLVMTIRGLIKRLSEKAMFLENDFNMVHHVCFQSLEV